MKGFITRTSIMLITMIMQVSGHLFAQNNMPPPMIMYPNPVQAQTVIPAPTQPEPPRYSMQCYPMQGPPCQNPNGSPYDCTPQECCEDPTTSWGAADYAVPPPWWSYQNPLDAGIPICTPKPPSDHFLFYAALLYWRAFESGLGGSCAPASITQTACDNVVSTDIVTGNDKNLDFDWNTGFRVGAQYSSGARGIDAGIFWSQILMRAHANKSVEPLNTASWKLNFQELDIILSHDFSIFSSVNFTPFAGLRASWINQRINAQSTGVFSGLTTISSIISTRNNRIDFWGVGPQIGGEVEWKWNCGISIFGGVGGAILYGDFDRKFNNVDEVGTSITTTGEKDSFTACQPCFDAEIGIRWRYNFCNIAYLIFQAGWEHHRYVDFNLLDRGDLCLDGGTFALGIEF